MLGGYLDAAKDVWSTDGLRGFYRGCGECSADRAPRKCRQILTPFSGLLLLREVPHNLIGLVVWDFLRTERQKRNARGV